MVGLSDSNGGASGAGGCAAAAAARSATDNPTYKHALRFEEEFIGVRPMSRGVTQRACLILLRLIVERRRGRSRRIHRERVTFETEQIHVAAFQQTRIRRTMRHVTRHATFRLHRAVFPCERTGLVGVTSETNLILRGRGAQLMRQESA